jgi:hypothetical protein
LEHSLNLESVLSAFFSFCLRPSIMSYAPLCFSQDQAILHHAQQKEQQQQQNQEGAATTAQAVPPPPPPLPELADCFLKSGYTQANCQARQIGLVDSDDNDVRDAIDKMEDRWAGLQ